MSEQHSHDWVVIDGFTDVIQADIVRGRLEVEGIPAILGNRHLVTADWMYAQALGGVRILVPREFVSEARALIADIDSGKFLDVDEKLGQEEVCADCGGKLARKTSASWKIALFSLHFLLPIPLPFRKNVFYCPQCGV